MIKGTDYIPKATSSCPTMKGSTPTVLACVLVAVVTLATTWEGVAAFAQPICRQKGRYLIANPQDCRSYYYCFEGEPFYGLCAAGHRFDEGRQSCLQASVHECFACPPTGAVHLANPVRCDRYVLCFHGVAHERICPVGLLFNQAIGQCDLMKNVVCNGRS
ncbi:protein obstructor-E-like [Anopheles ziemanni]|uniref:protein obstructor-E-like n=1 Tax=Anopheles coustani TaxID=139045 RepID=UPI00265954A4|nr:protein obstructor-E-like [Anopheles coustani]XP_058170376.1 protein obstructor-E-like [Anopheles ziemanni]